MARSTERSSSPKRRRRSPSHSVSRSPTPRKSSPGRRYSRSRSRSGSPARNSRDNPVPCKILGVFGLNYHKWSYSTTRRDLERHFSRYGDIDKVDLITDNHGRSRGFGFITFMRTEDAKRARSAMTDKEFHGRRIRVDFSISKGPHDRTPGHYLGRSRGGSPRRRRYSRSPSPRRRRSPSPRRRDESRSPSPRRRRYSRSVSPRRRD